MTGRRLRAAVFFCALLAQAARAGASADASYLAELQARAHATVLAQQPAWLRLGHWRPDRIGHGYNSTIDSPGFFLAKDGRGEPAAELDATLELFFSGTQIAGEPAQCRYLARYQWLRRQLEFDPARLPEASCERYQEWARGLDAARIAVVFASNDLNSPSSMFGHTLLRIDAHGQGDNERLLAYALNYAAADVNDGGVTYAWRGITGGYEGYFSIYPYYDKVKEYARFEHRDLWEYPLRLAADQVQLLLWHVWELRGVGSSYYFFSENCSYQLLSLIEVARPDLDLTGPFRRGVAYTIPVDTIRALRDSGLLDAPAYRPAAAKVFQHDYHQLGDDEQAWVQRYVRGEAGFDDAVFARADDAGRARMLEMAHEQLYFLFQQGEMPRSAGLERDHAALVERSRLPVDSGFAPAPQPAMPDQGHSSARTAAGARIDAHAAAAVLRWRPSYHDRLDPPAGYLSGGEIRFFDVSALAGDGGVRLDQVTLLSVQAVSPRDATFKPWSWQVALGARRLDRQRYAAAPRGALGGYLEGGGGWAWAPAAGVQLYGFGMLDADVNHDAARGSLVRAGLRAGAAWQWSPALTQELEQDVLSGLTAAAGPLLETRAGLQWSWSVNQGVRLTAQYLDTRSGSGGGAELSWQRYF